jgi:hypothetical protein
MTQDQFQQMLIDLMQHGLRIEMFIEDGDLWFNMNTGMKSHLHIRYDKDRQVAPYRGRYDVSGEIYDMEDLLHVVHTCDYGRGFANDGWFDILKGVQAP